MNELQLDAEEADILNSYEAGEWLPLPKSELARYQRYARATFRQNGKVNIQLPLKNLKALRKRALQKGIPYQTLITNILNQYLTGQLVERV